MIVTTCYYTVDGVEMKRNQLEQLPLETYTIHLHPFLGTAASSARKQLQVSIRLRDVFSLETRDSRMKTCLAKIGRKWWKPPASPV